ncbi:hypothetical protein E6W39_17560 [Kitasatospora acidiphila]|uniref:Uncharacterized protein n=1 Tax=Kitasatospora acidiphila TaxID=2567942 RepID=A0A540W458_9ACTN|nr:DUF6083 domain-containing protein [Kitasatospora acidiphila]TQF03707.1 hypothetical protein E6W39_17560 [Kitasatospora acidiphila]
MLLAPAAECGGREPVLIGEVIRAVGSYLTERGQAMAEAAAADHKPTGRCRYCQREAAWHPTVRGRWILLDLDDHPAHCVPNGRRWQVDPRGTVATVTPSAVIRMCRIAHWDVCPGLPAPRDVYLESVRHRLITGQSRNRPPMDGRIFRTSASPCSDSK